MTDERRTVEHGDQEAISGLSLVHSKTAGKNEGSQTHDIKQDKPSSATESEHGNDPNEVDWDGPADPHNSRNWSAWRRGMLVGIITCVVFSTSIASSAVAPAVPQILRAFIKGPRERSIASDQS